MDVWHLVNEICKELNRKTWLTVHCAPHHPLCTCVRRATLTEKSWKNRNRNKNKEKTSINIEFSPVWTYDNDNRQLQHENEKKKNKSQPKNLCIFFGETRQCWASEPMSRTLRTQNWQKKWNQKKKIKSFALSQFGSHPSHHQVKREHLFRCQHIRIFSLIFTKIELDTFWGNIGKRRLIVLTFVHCYCV